MKKLLRHNAYTNNN